ncbi:Pluviatolide O-methyltransferase [Euphorbia peplus]|nr:Pluviatolide O-methyltransferase [Euphorbia peplus]
MDLIDEKIKFQDHDHGHLLKSHAHIWNHTFNFIKSMSLKCAVELNIPDIIHNHGGPMTLSELESCLSSLDPSKSQHLPRLMRVLVDSGFFSLRENGYLLTAESLLLLKDHPLTARPYILAVLDPILVQPWQFLSAWFRESSNTNSTPFSLANGRTFWDLAGKNPRFNGFFNDAMASDSFLIGEVLVKKCKKIFDGVHDVLDVGGGTGKMAKAIVDAFPRLNCTVMDLPHVVSGLEDCDNLRFIAGNMFDYVPPADLIMFKMVFHLLNDEESIKVLKKCKEAILLKKDGDGGVKQVIIMDIVMDKDNQVHHLASETTKLYDLEMMVLVSGIERNENQWAKIFFDAGFTSYKIHHVLGLRSLIEVFL